MAQVRDDEFTRCPLCRQNGGARRTGVEIAGGMIWRCAVCGGYSLHPPVHVEYTDSGWTNSRQASWERDVRIGREFAPAIRALTESWLGRNITSVLEVGCGSAYMGVAFGELGVAYTGTEIDKTSIALAREHGLEVHDSTAEGLHASPLAGRKFDLILSSNVFEHLQDPPKAFANVAALAGGLIIVIVPNAQGLFMRLKAFTPMRRLIQAYKGEKREMAYSIDGYWHNIAYARQTLRLLAEGAGLRVQQVRGLSINDRPLGFVQRNSNRVYTAIDVVATRLGMASQLLLVAQTEPRP